MPNRSSAILSLKEMAFVEKYIETLNPRASAEYAGYKCPGIVCYQVLRRRPVQAAIEVRRLQVSAELNVTPAEVIRRMMYIGYCDPKDFQDEQGNWLPINQVAKEARLAISKIRVLRQDVEVERTTTQDGKATVQTVTTTRFKVLDYTTWDKVKMLNSLADHLNLFGGGRPKHPIEDMSLEELERLTTANEEAVRAIEGISEKSRKSVLKAAQKT